MAGGKGDTVAGGESNNASNDYSTIGGGFYNTASGVCATVSGGDSNTASGADAAVGGGYANTAAGHFSFVVGNRAKNTNSDHMGVFLFADSNDFDFPSTAANQFRVRATGGTQFVSAIDGSGNPTAGVTLAAGGGSWSSLSDRSLKTNFATVNGSDILDAISSLPITTWNYQAQDISIRHIGPMAQDFYTAFGVGEDDTHITTVDADGVALAGIQALYQQNQEFESRLATLEKNAGTPASALPNSPWMYAALILAGIVIGQFLPRRKGPAARKPD